MNTCLGEICRPPQYCSVVYTWWWFWIYHDRILRDTLFSYMMGEMDKLHKDYYLKSLSAHPHLEKMMSWVSGLTAQIFIWWPVATNTALLWRWSHIIDTHHNLCRLVSMGGGRMAFLTAWRGSTYNSIKSWESCNLSSFTHLCHPI